MEVSGKDYANFQKKDCCDVHQCDKQWQQLSVMF
jgi:hypothetical protein